VNLDRFAPIDNRCDPFTREKSAILARKPGPPARELETQLRGHLPQGEEEEDRRRKRVRSEGKEPVREELEEPFNARRRRLERMSDELDKEFSSAHNAFEKLPRGR
jgi:hypothetical protein